MDASAYNMSFDKEQLSVLCANYDRRIDVLDKERTKLRELVADLWNDAVTRMDFADRHAFIDKFGNRMRELEVEA